MESIQQLQKKLEEAKKHYHNKLRPCAAVFIYTPDLDNTEAGVFNFKKQTSEKNNPLT